MQKTEKHKKMKVIMQFNNKTNKNISKNLLFREFFSIFANVFFHYYR